MLRDALIQKRLIDFSFHYYCLPRLTHCGLTEDLSCYNFCFFKLMSSKNRKYRSFVRHSFRSTWTAPPCHTLVTSFVVTPGKFRPTILSLWVTLTRSSIANLPQKVSHSSRPLRHRTRTPLYDVQTGIGAATVGAGAGPPFWLGQVVRFEQRRWEFILGEGVGSGAIGCSNRIGEELVDYPFLACRRLTRKCRCAPPLPHSPTTRQ